MTSDAPAPVPSPAWRAWAWGTALALVAAAIHAATHRGEVFGPLADETLLLPIALRHADPTLFSGDRWLATTAPVFSVPYSLLIAPLISRFDDPVFALRLLSFPFHVLLLAGTWRLVERLAGSGAATVAAVLLVLPPCNEAVFIPGQALPRDLVFAALPWIFAAVTNTPSTRRLVGPALFAGLGVLSNLHPLTGLHVAMLLLFVGVVLETTARGVFAAVSRGVAFGLGAAPYAVQYLSRPATAGAVDPKVYVWRLPFMAGEGFAAGAARMEPAIWLAAAAVVLAVAARREARLPRALVVGAVVSFVLGAFGPTLARFVPPLRAVQLDRFERIADWYVVVVIAVCSASVWRRRAYVPLVVAAACLAAAPLATDVFGGAVPKGPIARVARAVERRAGAPAETPPPSGLPARTGVVDPSWAPVRDAFLATCRFAREKTSPDSLFIVPPESWGAFRVYARRGAAVTRKEGGAALSFLGGAGMDWYRDYVDAVHVYAVGGASDWDDLVAKWKADYVIVDDACPRPPARPVVFEAGKFRVFDVRRK